MENDKFSWQAYEGLWISFRSKALSMFSVCYYATCPLLMFLLLLCAHHFLSNLKQKIKQGVYQVVDDATFSRKKYTGWQLLCVAAGRCLVIP